MKSSWKALFCFATLCVSSFWSWLFSKPSEHEWDRLSVTWGFKIGAYFNALPVDEREAINEGWILTKACDANTYFAGNRYVLNGDTAVMLLYDSQGKIAGIQAGVQKSQVEPKTLPWNDEGDMYVMTAYFTDPKNICHGSRPSSDYLGDKLLIQTGNTTSQTMKIPFKEEDLEGTKWVKGKCFHTMGQHYWYKISRDMDCGKFFPVFLLYNGDRLNGFGWSFTGDLNSSRYEHPTPNTLKVLI